MSQVAIEKVDGKEPATATIFGEMKALSDRIRDRAYQIFEGRNGGEGYDLDDWRAAEKDLLASADSDFVEKDGKYEVQVSAPGFEAGDVHVTALPDALIVNASSKHKHDTNEGNARFCEFGQKSLFRRFDLPAPIDVDKVTADLSKGVLHLSAMKAKEASVKVPAVAA